MMDHPSTFKEPVVSGAYEFFGFFATLAGLNMCHAACIVEAFLRMVKKSPILLLLLLQGSGPTRSRVQGLKTP